MTGYGKSVYTAVSVVTDRHSKDVGETGGRDYNISMDGCILYGETRQEKNKVFKTHELTRNKHEVVCME